ncbi:hypothetical protein [Negadavirga shengliensis]|uniref:Uncharacterized protein n=1 Tax=Negadavirga shengliensis TaxID=1389218 RepID=A0ABV9T266_9BACT
MFKRAFTNFLAVFLVVLCIADGDDAGHEIPHTDIHLSEIDYDYVDFPTSLSRSSNSTILNLQREATIPFFTIVFDSGIRNLFSDSNLNKRRQIHLHPLLTKLTRVVVCKNAP